MAMMQITVIPLGTGTTSVGEFVAEIDAALALEKFSYQLTDMATNVQGEVGELFALAAKIHELPFNRQVDRVVTQITIDDRRKEVCLGDKIASVKDHQRLNS